ncbi:hypothetical protein D3C73_1475500 [compost metagenome]
MPMPSITPEPVRAKAVKISRSKTLADSGMPVPIITQTELNVNKTATRDRENNTADTAINGPSMKIRLNMVRDTPAMIARIPLLCLR